MKACRRSPGSIAASSLGRRRDPPRGGSRRAASGYAVGPDARPATSPGGAVQSLAREQLGRTGEALAARKTAEKNAENCERVV